MDNTELADALTVVVNEMDRAVAAMRSLIANLRAPAEDESSAT